MAYTSADMVYKHYKWEATYSQDDPKVTGEPDNTELNRKEGYEMLYFINKLATKWGWSVTSKSSCQNLEKIIRDQVPSNIRIQRGILEWIEANFTKISYYRVAITELFTVIHLIFLMPINCQ